MNGTSLEFFTYRFLDHVKEEAIILNHATAVEAEREQRVAARDRVDYSYTVSGRRTPGCGRGQT